MKVVDWFKGSLPVTRNTYVKVLRKQSELDEYILEGIQFSLDTAYWLAPNSKYPKHRPKAPVPPEGSEGEQ